MKKLSAISLALSAFLMVSISASAQNDGGRHMQKRSQDNSSVQYNQGNGGYNNGGYNKNRDEQYNQRNDSYNRGNSNDEYAYNRHDDRQEKYRRDDDRSYNRRPALRIVFSNGGYRNNERNYERRRDYNYDNSCGRRHY